MLATYHTHTSFCDGTDTPDAMAEAAFAAGYGILGFSAHAPVPLPSPGNLSVDRVEPYMRAVRETAALYEGRMEILAGLEIEWVPGLGIPGEDGYGPVSVDFRIGSLHFSNPPAGAPFAVDGPAEEFDAFMAERFEGDGVRLYRAYYRDLAELIQTGGFDILGHLDIVRKNNRDGRWFDETSSSYLASAFEAVEALEGTGIAAEVNTGGLPRGKTTAPYPILPILKELKRRKVPIVIGADAHAPAHLAPIWRHAGLEVARAAGYEELAVLSRNGWSSAPLE